MNGEDKHERRDTLSRSAAGDRNPWLIAVVVSIATFMLVLDTSIANVALRYIAGSMAAGLDESTWVITTYLVANAVIIPVSGWLADVIGRKRFYMLCVAVFTVASFFCGLAPNLASLIFFRIIQGLGGGGMAPSEQAILADTFPPEKRAQAFALYGVAVIVAPTVGPTLGGWITDNYSWHWIFLINVPIGAVSLILVHWLVPGIIVQCRQRLRQVTHRTPEFVASVNHVSMKVGTRRPIPRRLSYGWDSCAISSSFETKDLAIWRHGGGRLNCGSEIRMWRN